MPAGPQTSFDLYDRLAADLARSDDRGTPVYGLVAPDQGIAEDLTAVPDSARFVALNAQTRNTERLKDLHELEAAWIYAPRSPVLRDLLQLPKLRALHLMMIAKADVTSLAGHPSLAHLQLNWGHHVTSVEFLASIKSLRTLWLQDLKRIELETVPELSRVTALNLMGGMWSTLKVSSFAPLRRLPALRHLSLGSIRPLDDSLDAIFSLTNLETLVIPNAFEVEQHAALAARFPKIDSPSLRPIFSDSSSNKGQFTCKRCGGAQVMLTGRPAQLLCPACDKTRIEKRIARWEIARAAAAGPA